MNADIDTQMGVYSYNGSMNATLMATDDDSGGARNPRFTQEFTGGNQYLVIVRTDGTQTGAYQIQVTQAVLDSAGRIAIFGVSSTGSKDGSYSSTARYAHYQITAPSNATALTVRLTLIPNLAALDARLRVTDATGAVIGEANAAGAGGNEQLVNLPVKPGETYTITVYGNDTTAGNYHIDADFDPDFTITAGTEFPVAQSYSDQSYSQVARNASGQTVVVWLDWSFYPREVRFQRYGADGQAVGGAVTANQVSDANGLNLPDVAIAADGSFAVVWSRSGEIYFRRFDASGNALTNDVHVSQSNTLANEPRLAIGPNGEFVVVWSSFSHGIPDGVGVYAHRVSATGTLVGSEIHVNSTTTGDQYGPDVGFRPDGSFLVVWNSSVSGNQYAILATSFFA